MLSQVYFSFVHEVFCDAIHTVGELARRVCEEHKGDAESQVLSGCI